MSSKTNLNVNPDDGAWERVKTAFKRDWEQTKNDFGSKKAPDLDQDADDTVKQMFGSGKKTNFEDHESAFRYGQTAQSRYGETHKDWNDDLDAKLKKDYSGNYDADRPYIRYAYGRRY